MQLAHRFHSLAATLLVTIAQLVMIAESRADLSDDELERLADLCRPSSNELAWRSVPWMTDLWQAREVAARVGKPILLWEMDGHPLGCT